MSLFSKYKPALLLVITFISGSYLTHWYFESERKKDEKNTFARIYKIEPRSKSHVDMLYYFLTENKDTIKSELFTYPLQNKEYYLNGRFIVKYYSLRPENNIIYLDKSY